MIPIQLHYYTVLYDFNTVFTQACLLGLIWIGLGWPEKVPGSHELRYSSVGLEVIGTQYKLQAKVIYCTLGVCATKSIVHECKSMLFARLAKTHISVPTGASIHGVSKKYMLTHVIVSNSC